MYKILIADDEELIRKGIIAKLKYLKFNYSEIIEATDGKEALFLLKDKQPDIAITDIKMPNKDGIELIKAGKILSPDTKFVIISGYAEFKYAEQAVNLGVKGYLLKPIGKDNFFNTLSKVYKDIEKDKKINSVYLKNKALEKHYDELSLEQKLNTIFHSHENIKLSICNKDYRYLLAIINIDGKSYAESQFKYQDTDLIRFSIKNICDEVKIKCNKILSNNLENKNQIMILFYYDINNLLELYSNKYLFEILLKIKKYLKISVTIGTSNSKNNITYKLYYEATEAVNQKIIYGDGKLYIYQDNFLNTKISLPISEMKLLERCIHRCDITNINVILKNIFSRKYIKNNPLLYTRMIWYEVSNMLIKVCNDLSIGTDRTINSLLLNEKMIEKFDNIEDIIDYLYSTILDVLEYKDINNMNYKDRVKLVINYIEKHYQEQITVNDLADEFEINKTYFSTLFKKDTNKTVIQYLTDIRLRKACELLKNTNDSVVCIARKVGFEDVQYFFRVFKKNIGRTPLEYKKVH